MVVGFDLESKETVDVSGPMDSPWPMKSHDNRHTGRSPYSTANNPGIEKWRFKCGWVEDSAVIDEDGTLYFGDEDWDIYAVNPDGTLKWKYHTDGDITSAPAIDEDGTLYVCSWDNHLYAINPDGTLEWKYNAGMFSSLTSSPIIADDGTIYFGNMGPDWGRGRVHAVNPDGTEKWYYDTGDSITSDPAIANDGTIYIGSMDKYLYALNPNGTLRWRFRTDDYVKSPVSLADDGTIYFGSFDDHLYALYPNGTLKWKVNTNFGTSANPSIGTDGTIYVGIDKLYAINPDGTIKWTFDLGPDRWIGWSSPAISSDGTIYVGTHIGEGKGGDIIAINLDGTEKWRKKIADYWVDSSPCIGEDGTVYIGSAFDMDRGYLHAFGSVESNEPPGMPIIGGPSTGKKNEELYFHFTSIDPDNNPVSFYVDWGDGRTTESTEYASGEKAWIYRTYTSKGNFTITAKAKDMLDEESSWSSFDVEIFYNSPSKPTRPYGETNGKIRVRYNYITYAIDPDGDKIKYGWDWDGDGNVDEWTDFYHSGESVVTSHTWKYEGTYSVKVKAEDKDGLRSEWSDPLIVTIPRYKPTSLLYWFLEEHPRLLLLLRQIIGS